MLRKHHRLTFKNWRFLIVIVFAFVWLPVLPGQPRSCLSLQFRVSIDFDIFLKQLLKNWGARFVRWLPTTRNFNLIWVLPQRDFGFSLLFLSIYLVPQGKRRLRSCRGTRLIDWPSRCRRYLLRVLQNDTRMEICECTNCKCSVLEYFVWNLNTKLWYIKILV